MNVVPKKSVDNGHFVTVLMDYVAVIFTHASSLSSSMIHMGELLSILRDLRQPLKQAFNYIKSRISGDIELHGMLQQLLAALQTIDNEVLQKVKYKNSADLLQLDSSIGPHLKKLEYEVNNMIFFLRRIGLCAPPRQDMATSSSIMSSSSWALTRPTNEHPPASALWPLLFLPDRNMFYLPRDDLMIKTLSMMQPPAKKPTHLCVVNKGGHGGLGRTQLVLEATYNSIEKGSFGVVFWLSCLSEASLVSSYRHIARKISKIDPNFCDLLESIDGDVNFLQCTEDLLAHESSLSSPDDDPTSAHAHTHTHTHCEFIISLVVGWLSRVPVPYLMVFDSADDTSFFSSNMFPQIGQGSIVIVTGFSHLSRWTTLLETRPKAVELTTLSYEEGLQMSEYGLDTTLDDQSDKEAVMEILKYFHFSPSEFCNAILTINCMRNSSFVNIGPKDYLNRIKSDVSGPAGLIVNLTSGSHGDILHRIDIAYRSSLMRLYSAQDFEYACQAVQTRLMDLLAFISPSHVSTRLLYEWLSPEKHYSPMKIVIKLNRPSGLAHVPRGKDAETAATELVVDVRSCLPRILQSSGDTCYEWKVLRCHTDLKSFFDSIQPHCSSKLKKDMLPSFSIRNNEIIPMHKIVKQLNTAFTLLCEDPLWPRLCDQQLVKKFLNIHANDSCQDSKTSKIARILDPLISVGLVYVEHRSKPSDEEGGNEMGEDDSRNVLDDDLVIGLSSGVQDALVYTMEQNNRLQEVAQQCVQFVFDYFQAAAMRETQVVSSGGTTEDGYDSISISREQLLPHVLKMITMQQRGDTEIYMKLCQLAFAYATQQELFNSAELIASRTIQFFKEVNGTSNSTFLHNSDGKVTVDQRRLELDAVAMWQRNLAYCVFKQGRYSESEIHFKQALMSRKSLSSTPNSDVQLADLEREMADNAQCMQDYTTAALHYEAALAIYQTLLISKLKTGQLNEIQNHVLHIYENLTLINVHEKKFSLAIKYNDMVRESRLTEAQRLSSASASVVVVQQAREKAMMCLHGKARMLVSINEFESAREIFLSTLQDCDNVYGQVFFEDGSINKSFRFSFSQLRNKVLVLCNLSHCLSGLAEYTEAKAKLQQAEMLFEKYEAYHKDCKEASELSEHHQNKKATSKLQITVLECTMELLVELGELEAAVPYTERTQSMCIELYGPNHHMTSLMSCQAGNLFKSLGRFNEATQLFKKVLGITDHNIRLDGAVVALNSLADMAATQAEFTTAENYLQDALKILQYKFKQGNDLLVADQFILLAELKKEQHLFENAKEFFESALAIQKSCCGEVHVSVAHTLGFLADLFSDRGEHLGAQGYREQSARIYEQLRLQDEQNQQGHGQDVDNRRGRALSLVDGYDSHRQGHGQGHGHSHGTNQMSASALHSMASLLTSVAGGGASSVTDLDTSEPLHTRALRILTSQYGKNHPRVAMALNNLAKVLSKKGKKSEAQAMLETALSILRKVHGENHPHVASAVHNLGMLLGDRGEFDNAIAHVLSALKIRRLVAAGNSLLLSDSLRTLGFLYYQVGNLPLSREALEECLALRRDLFSGVENNYPIAVSLNNLGVVLKSLLLHTQAEECLRESLSLRLSLHGDPNVEISEDMENRDKNYHPVISFAWHTLGGLLVSMARFREARLYLEHALAARKMSYGDVHVEVANSLHSLAELCICEKRYGEAALLLREAVDIRVALHGENSPIVLATGRALWMLSIDSQSQQEQGVEKERSRDGQSPCDAREHSGKILFGSEQESEVFLRIKANISRMDSTHSMSSDVNTGEQVSSDDVLSPTPEKGKGVTTDAVALAHSEVLRLVMSAFEEDQETSAAAQFLKFEAVRKAQIALNKLTQSQKSSQYSNIEGGEGWPERLIQKMLFDKNGLTTELREIEVDMIEKRSAYGLHEALILQLRGNLNTLRASLRALEVRAQADRRVQFELDEARREEGRQVPLLEAKELDPSMANLLIEIKGLEETISVRELQLKELSQELIYLEETTTLYLHSKTAVNKIDKEISAIEKKIEACRWKMVDMDTSDNSVMSKQQQQQSGGDVLKKVEGREGETRTSVVHDVAEGAMKAEVAELIRSKVDHDIAREMEEVTYQRAFNKLESLRKKYKISARNQSETLKALAATPAQTSAGGKSGSATNDSEDDDDDDDDNDDDDDDEDVADEDDTEEGQSKANARKMATKNLKKKIKKQKMLIDLLKNQIINLGHKPIAEIVTYHKAESNLQNALARLMDGDETASDDFDKWDEFVRNHPEYKAKQLRLKERFKQENLAINKAALRMFKTLVPPGIVSTCTLVTLEEGLPKGVAKRVWQTKALWLTRISADRIARLHVADLQSKYSPQGLDELELRAVYAALPEKFDNDAKGDKAGWCEAILQGIQAKCKRLPWSKADDDEGPDSDPSEEEVQAYIASIPRNVTYRNFVSTGPYDPDEEAAEVEDAASSRDEVSSRDEMLQIMSTVQAASSSASTNATTGEGPPTSATTSSIRRRASMFGASQKAGPSNSAVSDKKREESIKPPGPPKIDFFGELKLKAAAKKKREVEEAPKQVPGGGGGMAGFLGELQSAAKKKNEIGQVQQSRRSSVA